MSGIKTEQPAVNKIIAYGMEANGRPGATTAKTPVNPYWMADLNRFACLEHLDHLAQEAGENCFTLQHVPGRS